MATNIFDTRNIIKQTPKIGNRFLLTPDKTQLDSIITKSKIKKLNYAIGGDDGVFGITGEKVNAKNNFGRPADILNLSLLSCTIPAFEFEVGDVNRFNDTVKHITKFSAVNDMSSVFYDYINGSATSIMLAWQACVGFKLTGEIGYKSQYVCDMDLYVYGPNRPGYITKALSSGDTLANFTDSAENELLMQFKILNAYPRSVDIGEFSYDSAEIKKVTVQFGYDMIVPIKNKTRSQSLRINNNSGFGDKMEVIDRTDMSNRTEAQINDNQDAVYGIFINNKYSSTVPSAPENTSTTTSSTNP